MKIEITLTARELIDRGIWCIICELRGINPYAVAEGLIDMDEEFVLDKEEIKELGW